MKKAFKNNIIAGISVLIFINVITGFLLLKSRSFSHLAIWNIIESGKQADFYWSPENAPPYFHFQPDNGRIGILRNDFEMALGAAKYVMSTAVGANCFHRSVLLSAYLSGLGLKSRLWALENDKFNGIAHTVTEVYIKSFKKWVFIDVMLNFYVTENGNPLSFLELRERLLNDNAGNISVQKIGDGSHKQHSIPAFYNRLIKCVFLRADKDFIAFPDNIKRGFDYLLGRRHFIHYVDRYSKSLKPAIIMDKALFYLFILTLISSGIFLMGFSLIFVKRYLATALSKKDTRHR